MVEIHLPEIQKNRLVERVEGYILGSSPENPEYLVLDRDGLELFALIGPL